MSERRIKQRVREETRVAVTVLSADEAPELLNRTFFCSSADISATGLRLAVHRIVPVGALLTMRIAFKRPLRSFKHDGRVVWVNPGEAAPAKGIFVGVQFTKLQDGTAESWWRMLDEKVQQQDGAAAVGPVPTDR